jgi:hypothetical protein
MFLPVGADIIIVKLLFNETLDKRTKLFLDFFFSQAILLQQHHQTCYQRHPRFA